MLNFTLMVLALIVALAVIEGLKMAFGSQIALLHMKQGLTLMKSPKARAMQEQIAYQMMASLSAQAETQDLREDSGNYDLNTL